MPALPDALRLWAILEPGCKRVRTSNLRRLPARHVQLRRFAGYHGHPGRVYGLRHLPDRHVRLGRRHGYQQSSLLALRSWNVQRRHGERGGMYDVHGLHWRSIRVDPTDRDLGSGVLGLSGQHVLG